MPPPRTLACIHKKSARDSRAFVFEKVVQTRWAVTGKMFPEPGDMFVSCFDHELVKHVIGSNIPTAGITEIWKKGPAKPEMIRIQVQGTSNLGNFVLFRNILNDIAGVKRIQIKELKADTSTIMVDYSRSTKSLADSLMVKTYETFSINISEVSEEHLQIELVSK